MREHEKEMLIYIKYLALHPAKIACFVCFNLYHIIISSMPYSVEGIQADG